ncbi:MAG: hypothetical protein AB7E24_16640 [Novosphingobium sp.]
MRSILKKALVWSADKLSGIAANIGRQNQAVEAPSKFVDLAPTDQADKSGVYSDALEYALGRPKVSNIALTGPYGSGKSSIIQTFLKRYDRKALHISLAAFLPEAGSQIEKVSRQEIERSILQQMLYGADADKLPLSRFKRIRSPGLSAIFVSIFVTVGLIALWHVLSQTSTVVDGSFFDPIALKNWRNLASFALATAFLWASIHHLYIASFGLSLKSISLKDVELRPASDDLESILNRHLDEIIYFFQSTDHDLVIIEDLDRFDNAEIFVTLREINSLVNENAGVKRRVRFLYALRDDMFANTDRTKFFEFIIPVIPIINTSNSIDMVLQQGERLDLDERLDRQFLREVSRHLDDLRLIQNIFNEYAIYSANIESDEDNLLDANKLLAILIYKNVCPRDFERLHRSEGNLADLLGGKPKLVAQGEAAKRDEITKLEALLKFGERQVASDLKQLRQIYAMELIEMLPTNTISLNVGNAGMVSLAGLPEHDQFESLLSSDNVTVRTFNGNQRVGIADVQNRVDPNNSYQERKSAIEANAHDAGNDTMRRVRTLRAEIASLRTSKFEELLRSNADQLDELFAPFGENGALARFLILEGHLDDTYYQYTSLFHSGRLSPDDNRFLIQIRAFTTPEPDFPIDNPKEVAAAMREDDFRQSYVLNVTLVDCLLADPSRYAGQITKLLEFLSANFGRAEEFLDVYYASGTGVPPLLDALAERWNGFVPAVISSGRNISHVTRMLSSLSERRLEELATRFDELPRFVTENLPKILAEVPELDPIRLESLEVEVKVLASIESHQVVLRYMFERGYFELSFENLAYAYEKLLGEKDVEGLRCSNYTTLRAVHDTTLSARVERDFAVYLEKILLELKDNIEESPDALLAIIERDDVDEEAVERLLKHQSTFIPALEDVPARWVPKLFDLGRIQPTWSNCLAFMHAEGYEEERLADYLDRDEVRTTILQQPIPDDDATASLRRFLLNAGSLSEDAYRDYVAALPRPFKAFPEGIGPDKSQILIDEQKIVFAKDTFEELAADRDLQVSFLASNIETYLAGKTGISIDDDFREELVKADIDDAQRHALIGSMDLASLPDVPGRAAVIAPILERVDRPLPELSADQARLLIENVEPVRSKISLLNKVANLLPDEMARDILSSLPAPYSQIRKGYFTPYLDETAENLELVTWLDDRDIISSWSRSILTGKIRVNLKRR